MFAPRNGVGRSYAACMQTSTATAPATSTRAERLSTDYRALWTCAPSGHWLTDVEDQFSAWWRKKHRQEAPVDLRGDAAWNEGHLSLRVRHHEADRSTALRIESTDRNEAGLWRTQLLAVDRGEASWLSLSVASDRGRFVAVPNLARFLMQALRLRDGDSDVVDHVRVVDSRGIDDLVALVLDPERRLPVFVAGSDERLDFDPWSARMGKWFRQIYGVGHGVVMTPDATEAFRAQMPPGAEARPWAIRTYLRDVGDDDSASLRRHRFLGTQRLAEMRDEQVAELLGRVARDETGRRAGTPEITAWERRFTRLLNADLVTTAPAPAAPTLPTPAVRPPSPPVGLSSSAVAEALGLDVLDADALTLIRMQLEENTALREQIRDANARLSEVGERFETYELHTQSLEDENAFFEELVDDLNLDLQIAEREQIAAEDEIRRLRGLLSSAGRTEEAFDVTASAPVIPEDYEGLLEAVRDLDDHGVVFTGDEATVLALEDIAGLNKCVASAWRACLALVDYVDLKARGEIDQDVHWYLEHGPAGRKFPPRSHARGETAETLRRFGKERIFPVPSEVDPTGCRQMVAHFKLGRLGRQDPRLHYFDDTPNTGKVYVGYIGPHLTSVQTANS